MNKISICGVAVISNLTVGDGNSVSLIFLVLMRCSLIFFAVLQCSGTPNVPLMEAKRLLALEDYTCLHCIFTVLILIPSIIMS